MAKVLLQLSSFLRVWLISSHNLSGQFISLKIGVQFLKKTITTRALWHSTFIIYLWGKSSWISLICSFSENINFRKNPRTLIKQINPVFSFTKLPLNIYFKFYEYPFNVTYFLYWFVQYVPKTVQCINFFLLFCNFTDLRLGWPALDTSSSCISLRSKWLKSYCIWRKFTLLILRTKVHKNETYFF